jgi:hypothetical protein
MRRIAFSLGTAFALATLLAFSLNHPGPAQAVNQIGLTETCTAGGLKQDLLSWPAGDPRATQTLVDVSLINASWQPGTFARYGPFGPQAGVTIVGIPYQTGVFVRLVQVLPGGLTDTSPTFAFQTSWCGYKFGDIIAPSVDAANAIISARATATPSGGTSSR